MCKKMLILISVGLLLSLAATVNAELIARWGFDTPGDELASNEGYAISASLPNGGGSFVSDPVRGPVLYLDGAAGAPFGDGASATVLDISTALSAGDGFDKELSWAYWVSYDTLAKSHGGLEGMEGYPVYGGTRWVYDDVHSAGIVIAG